MLRLYGSCLFEVPLLVERSLLSSGLENFTPSYLPELVQDPD